MSTEPERDTVIADSAMCVDAWRGVEEDGKEGIARGVTVLLPVAASALSSTAARDCDAGRDSRGDGATSVADQARYMNLRQKYNRKTVQEPCRPKREAARNMCRPLKQWLYSHRELPYPSKADKLELATQSQMTVIQVSNWFANARRRLKKTVSSSVGLSWERRFKLYNRNVVGNQERMSISSEDAEDDRDDRLKDFTSDEDDDDDDDDDESCEANSATSTKPCSTSSGNFSSEEKDSLAPPGDHCTNLPGKFKQGILHRYLNDSYNMSFVDTNVKDLNRNRKMSGSPNSPDSAMSTSCRSTPIKDQQIEDTIEKTDVYRNGFVLDQDESDEYDLQSMEISAAHILASLAGSSRNSLRQ